MLRNTDTLLDRPNDTFLILRRARPLQPITSSRTQQIPNRTDHTTRATHAHTHPSKLSRHGRGGEEARPRRSPPRAVVPGHPRCHVPPRACSHCSVLLLLLLVVARGGQLPARARRRAVGAPGVARGDGRVGEGVRRHHLREGRRGGHRQGDEVFLHWVSMREILGSWQKKKKHCCWIAWIWIKLVFSSLPWLSDPDFCCRSL